MDKPPFFSNLIIPRKLDSINKKENLSLTAVLCKLDCGPRFSP